MLLCTSRWLSIISPMKYFQFGIPKLNLIPYVEFFDFAKNDCLRYRLPQTASVYKHLNKTILYILLGPLHAEWTFSPKECTLTTPVCGKQWKFYPRNVENIHKVHPFIVISSPSPASKNATFPLKLRIKLLDPLMLGTASCIVPNSGIPLQINASFQSNNKTNPILSNTLFSSSERFPSFLEWFVWKLWFSRVLPFLSPCFPKFSSL